MENCPSKAENQLRSFLPYLKTEGPLPCSQELTTEFYPEQVETILQSDVFV
jgi:hypothetical protein